MSQVNIGLIGYKFMGKAHSAIIGAIAGGGQGAAVGTGVGGAVGLATVLFSRGRELILTPGTQFDLVLKQPLRFAYGELSFTSEEMESARHSLNVRRYNRDHNHSPYEPSREPGPSQSVSLVLPW